MLKYLLPLALIFATPAIAGQEIDVCNGCRITYQTTRVVKKVVRPAPVAVVPAVPVVPAQQLYTIQQVPAGIGIVSSAVEVPVAVPVVPVVQPRPVCTSYPDPWDTLGYIFGDPIMITVCQ